MGVFQELRIIVACALVLGCDGAVDPAVVEGPPLAGTAMTERDLNEEHLSNLGRLGDIGYTDGEYEPSEVVAVTVHAAEHAFEGLNFYVSAHAPVALLADMEGNLIHTWSVEFEEVWPDRMNVKPGDPGTRSFRRAFLLEGGFVLAIFEDLGLVKLDKDSEVVWANPNRAHHDLAVLPSGGIYALTRKWVELPGEHEHTLMDHVSLLDPQGRTKREVSLLECMQNSEFAHLWDAVPEKTGDAFHTNTLEILDGSIAERVPAFARGRLLLSMRNLDALAVLDLDREVIVWAHRGTFRQQHDPRILANGNLLLLDNLGKHPFSRVVEYDPLTMGVVWSYEGSLERPFFTFRCGTAQRLPNGNTLITESSRGRVFEVLPDGTIVWEFHNPGRTGENDDLVARIYELNRVDPSYSLDWMRGH